jgi:uncharacterized membrane protein
VRAVRWLAPVAGWIVFLLLFRRFGKEYGATTDVGEYLREPPDDPPAFVPTLMHWGDVQPIALSATIVDLAQRGFLTITETHEDHLILKDKTDWRLTQQAHDEPLRPFEAAVLGQLFGEGPETTQSAFAHWCRNHRTDADRWWRDVKSKVKADFDARAYLEGGKGAAYAINVLVAFVVIGLSIAAVAAGATWAIVGIVAGTAQALLTALLRRRTPAGAQRLAEWQAFKRFLKDFSQLEDAPVGHLILWERYLVYAVALGVTAEVARALAAKIPPPDQATGAGVGFAPWFVGMHGPGALDSIGSFAGFASGFGPAIVAAATPQSSASSGSGFGGGGFSGGGGGGGGGGGIGAS